MANLKVVIAFLATLCAIAVVQAGPQCGGIYGPNCTCSGGTTACQDAPWAPAVCAAGTTCIRHSQDFWECRDNDQLQYWAGNPKPATKPATPVTVPAWQQCGGITGSSGNRNCYASGGDLPCTTAQWDWATCEAGYTCKKQSCNYWQCAK